MPRMIPRSIPKILAALTMLCVASIGSAKDNFIDGQVFIVTGHESVKLGLVTVAAYRPDEFASAAASTQSRIESERPEARRCTRDRGSDGCGRIGIGTGCNDSRHQGF